MPESLEIVEKNSNRLVMNRNRRQWSELLHSGKELL